MHLADLGHPAGVHDGDAVTGLGNHAHVMGDQHHRRAALPAEFFKQTDDLRLDGHVQRGGRFVRHDQAGLCRQRQRNHHALTHAAAELVREVVNALFGGRYAGVLQQINGAPPGLRGRHRQMRQNGFSQLPANAVKRVQRCQRVLKNRPDLAPADGSHLIRRQVINALAFQQNFSAGDAPGRLQQADDGRAGQRLAGTRFTHHAQNFTRCDVKGNAVQRPQRAVPAGKLDNQVFHLQQAVVHTVSGLH